VNGTTIDSRTNNDRSKKEEVLKGRTSDADFRHNAILAEEVLQLSLASLERREKEMITKDISVIVR
jgi:hypothetical protein